MIPVNCLRKYAPYGSTDRCGTLSYRRSRMATRIDRPPANGPDGMLVHCDLQHYGWVGRLSGDRVAARDRPRRRPCHLAHTPTPALQEGAPVPSHSPSTAIRANEKLGSATGVP